MKASPTHVQPVFSSAAPRAASTATPGSSPARITATTARDGLRGPHGPLPYLREIQASFGRHDITGTRAFTGGAAKRAAGTFRARAFATRSSVVFGEKPTLFAAAHEAAHIVQQDAGVSLKNGRSRPGDPFERHADAVAARVVRGETAENLLDRSPAGSNTSGETLQMLGPSYLPEADGPNAMIPLAPAAVSNRSFDPVADRFYAGLVPNISNTVPVNPAVPLYPNNDPNDMTELVRTRDINPYLGQIDHIFPESLGGGNSFINAQLVSAPVNNAKGNTYPDPISGASGTRVFLGTKAFDMPAGTILETDHVSQMVKLDSATAVVPKGVPVYSINFKSSLTELISVTRTLNKDDSPTGNLWVTLGTAQLNKLAPPFAIQP